MEEWAGRQFSRQAILLPDNKVALPALFALQFSGPVWDRRTSYPVVADGAILGHAHSLSQLLVAADGTAGYLHVITGCRADGRAGQDGQHPRRRRGRSSGRY